MSKFKERAKDFAAAGLNKLPDNANLFLRYMTGLGGRNLDLDDRTISNIREASKEADKYTTRFDREFIDEMGEKAPKSVKKYYGKIVPLAYHQGFLSIKIYTH